MKNTLILISSLLIISTFVGCSSKQKNAEQQSDKKQLIGMVESADSDLLPQRPPK